MTNNIKIYEEMIVKDISDIKPYWRNPRKNDKTVKALCEIIPVVGFNVPLYIDNEGVIIKGHARYRAAVKLGLNRLPCIISTNSEEQNKLDRISDNKISELSEWDIPELRYELEQIDFPMENIGFEEKKEDFMINEYEQHEYQEVKDSDFEKAKRNILNQAQSSGGENKEMIKYFTEKEEEQQKAQREEKVIRIKCPCCGKEFFWDRNK